MSALEVRLDLDHVNPLALQCAKMFDSLPPAEVLKLESEFDERRMRIKNTAAGFKKLTNLIGFMYVQAIRQAREQQLAKLQPLSNQKDLFTERTNA